MYRGHETEWESSSDLLFGEKQDTNKLAFHTDVHREVVLSYGIWSTQPATDSWPQLPRVILGRFPTPSKRQYLRL